MLAVIGVDHLHLYLGMYKDIPKIGKLFLANLAVSAVLAILVLVRPLAIFTLAAVLFALGTAAFYAYSLQAPLFQFMESGISYSGGLALAAEGATVLAAVGLVLRRRRTGAPAPAPGTDPGRWAKA